MAKSMESGTTLADPVRARLVELAGARGVSLAALSGMLGRNASYLQQFVRKGSPRKLEEQDRAVLAGFFGVSEAELGAAPAPVWRSGVVERAGFGVGHGVSRALAEWAEIPRLALGASAGPGAVPAPEEAAAAGLLRFSQRWLRGQGFAPEALSVIAVEGDSMEPTLRHGDEILVDRTLRPLSAGVHVLRLDDVLLVKRLEPAPGGQIAVISDNPAYPRQVRPADEVVLIGRVVWKGGRL